MLQRKTFLKCVNRLEKLGVTGTQEQHLAAYRQLLSLDSLIDLRADAERKAMKEASTAAGKQLPIVSSFFEPWPRNDKGKGKEVKGDEDEMEDGRGIEGPPEEEAGSSDAADEVTDPNVELAGLSSEVEISRIAVIRLYFGRLKSW